VEAGKGYISVAAGWPYGDSGKVNSARTITRWSRGRSIAIVSNLAGSRPSYRVGQTGLERVWRPFIQNQPE